MKLRRCPFCHHHQTLEAFAQDEAAQAIAGIITRLNAELSIPLAVYLGLFRAKSRDLANERALRLMKEVLALDDNKKKLAIALGNAIDGLQKKRDKGIIKPLKDHEYLKTCLEGVQLPMSVPGQISTATEDNPNRPFPSIPAAPPKRKQEISKEKQAENIAKARSIISKCANNKRTIKDGRGE